MPFNRPTHKSFATFEARNGSPFGPKVSTLSAYSDKVPHEQKFYSLFISRDRTGVNRNRRGGSPVEPDRIGAAAAIKPGAFSAIIFRMGGRFAQKVSRISNAGTFQALAGNAPQSAGNKPHNGLIRHQPTARSFYPLGSHDPGRICCSRRRFGD